MSEHAKVVRVATVRPQTGREAELIEVARRQAELLSSLDGCFGAQVCRSDRNPESITVISRWRDQPSLDAYYGSGDFMRARNEALQLVTEQRSVEHYTSI